MIDRDTTHISVHRAVRHLADTYGFNEADAYAVIQEIHGDRFDSGGTVTRADLIDAAHMLSTR